MFCFGLGFGSFLVSFCFGFWFLVSRVLMTHSGCLAADGSRKASEVVERLR